MQRNVYDVEVHRLSFLFSEAVKTLKKQALNGASLGIVLAKVRMQ